VNAGILAEVMIVKVRAKKLARNREMMDVFNAQFLKK